MSERFQRVSYCALLFVTIYANIAIAHTLMENENDRGRIFSFAHRVCDNTIRLSEQASFLIADFNSESSVPTLIQTLHNSSIQTVSTTHYCNLLETIEKTQVRNMIFFLDDVHEITSLILSSVSGEMGWREDCTFDVMNIANSEKMYLRKMPMHCIIVDESTHPMADKMCEERMFISLEELDGSSVLSDRNFNITRSLYTNPIWNSKNHLIFMLRDFNRGCYQPTRRSISPNGTFSNDHDALIICFKFIWRFFRGLRTVICWEFGCSRYDHFAENVIWYTGKDQEVYFDFSVTNMHGKPLKLVADDVVGRYTSESYFDAGMMRVQLEILAGLAESTNATLTNFFGFVDEDTGHEIGQKWNIDFHRVYIGATTYDPDYSQFDFAVGIETEAACILTPHSKLLPQGLVPFKVFTLVVWIFLGLTVTAFILMQHIFSQAHGRSFQSLYSERDISLFNETSSVYTVYAYFMCGSPPRLLLGKLFTGRILFIIFIFSALIISTIFLGGMTTLLTDTVQYPEIDTLKDLEDSDLFIQVYDTESAATFFAQLGLSEKMEAKLSNTLRYTRDFLSYEHVNDFAEEWREIPFQNSNLLSTLDQPNLDLFLIVSKEFEKNIQAIMENDAFLVTLPLTLNSGNRFVLDEWPLKEKVEFHLVAECLRVHPHSNQFLKNSFLFDKYNERMVRFFESGHVKKVYELDLHQGPQAAHPPLEDEEPRPYSLNDLQLPFISLVLGLILSLLVFVAEMVVEDFENSYVFRLSRRFKNYLSSKTVIWA